MFGFGRNRRLVERAREIPNAAHLVAISSFDSFTQRHPDLRMCDPKAWDSLATVGLVGGAAFLVPSQNPGVRQRVMQAAAESGAKMLPSFRVQLEDLSKFFVERAHVLESLCGDELRAAVLVIHVRWVLWNLLLKEPKSDHDDAVGELAYFFETVIADLWAC